MANFTVEDPELHQSSPLVLAGVRHLGLPHSGASRRSSSSLCSADSCQRPEFNRRWKLASGKQCLARSPTALPGIPEPQPPEPSRAAAHRLVGASVDRGPYGSSEGSRHLHRVQEEVRRQTPDRWEDREGEGGRSSSKGPSKGQSEARAIREGKETERARWTGHVRHCWLDEEVEKEGEGPKVGGPLNPDDSQPQIHVPGAAASTFSPKAHLQRLFKVLWKGRCRLSGFARSFATFCRHRQDRLSQDGTASQGPFPLPNPYPEVFQPRRSFSSKDDARKKWVFAAVSVLNYLHLGKPRCFASVVAERRRPNKMQWEIVRRLEGFLRSWMDVSQIGPEEMGRTAESLECTLRQLEARARALAKPGAGYFDPRVAEDEIGDPTISGSLEFGKMDGGSLTTFKSVDPNRLSFAGRPVFDPSPFLDSRGRQIFNDPLACRLRQEDYVGSRPKLRVHASAANKVKLFELLDATNRLGLHAPDEVSPDFGSGMFSITKDLEKDRLILDSRGANLLEAPSQRWIRSLGSAETLTKIHIPDHCILRSSSNDLRDFYYGFSATESHSRRNVLVGEIKRSSVQHLHCMKPYLHQHPYVYASMATLAMGDCQAVELAQTCHMGMAIQNQILSPSTCLAMGLPPPRGSTMIGILIDDFVSLALCSKEDSSSPSNAARLADQMQQAYEDVQLLPNHKKSFRDEEVSSFWGADLDGVQGVVRGSLRRAIPVAALCLEVASMGFATADLMQVLAGAVISLFLFRRRLLSLLDPLFQSYRGKDPRAIIKLGPKTRETLLLIVILLPVAASNLRAHPSPWLGASDASGWGEAAVITKVEEKIYLELLRHCLRKSLWVKLLSP